MMTKTKYDWKKTLLKVAIVSGEVILASLVVYLTENNLWLMAVPILEGIRNWLKNKN